MTDKGLVPDNHEVCIFNRELMTIKGVVHVDSFDDQEIVVDTEQGMLVIKGEDLHIKELNLEQGSFSVDGLISGLHYSTGGRSRARGKGKGLIERLLK